MTGEYRAFARCWGPLIPTRLRRGWSGYAGPARVTKKCYEKVLRKRKKCYEKVLRKSVTKKQKVLQKSVTQKCYENPKEASPRRGMLLRAERVPLAPVVGCPSWQLVATHGGHTGVALALVLGEVHRLRAYANASAQPSIVATDFVQLPPHAARASRTQPMPRAPSVLAARLDSGRWCRTWQARMEPRLESEIDRAADGFDPTSLAGRSLLLRGWLAVRAGHTQG